MPPAHFALLRPGNRVAPSGGSRPSVFFLNTPIAATALALAIQVRPDRGGSLEFLSPIFGVLCLGSMSHGLIEAGTGASLRGAAFVLLALPLGALSVWRERRARHPVVPPRLFRDRRFVVANAMTAVLYASLTGSPFLLPFVLIYTYGYSTAAAGAAFLPFSAIMAAGSCTAGGLAQRIGSRAMLAAGSLVTASGYDVFALSAERPEYWRGFLPGLEFMQINFGKAGSYYYWISRGVDNREVRADRIRKSAGAENTFFTDLTEFEAMVSEHPRWRREPVGPPSVIPPPET